MTEQFEQKITNLNSKLHNMHKPSTSVQKKSKIKQKFIQIRQRMIDRFQILQKTLGHLNQRLIKHESKIQRSKLTLREFSLQKHDELIDILSQWVEEFDNKLYKAKQFLKQYQTVHEIKLNELQTDHSILMMNLETKITNNLNSIRSELSSITKNCRQNHEYIVEEFNQCKDSISQLVMRRQKQSNKMEKQIKFKIGQIQENIQHKIKILQQKWSKKDRRTKQIFERLVQQDSLV